MPIQNEEELTEKVEQASRLLQEIQGYCGRENIEAARVRFPKGFLLTAVKYRATLPTLNQPRLAHNISYALMTVDTLAWLAMRTDIGKVALEMIIKQGICLIGSICESLTIRCTEHGLGRGSSFTNRTARLVELEVITPETKTELDWVWEIRNREHLIALGDLEIERYDRDDFNRARQAYFQLRDHLNAIYG